MCVLATVFVLITGPVKNNYLSRNNYTKKFDFIWWYIGVIKEGVLTEAGPVIRTKTVY